MKEMFINLSTEEITERPIQDMLAGGRLLTCQLVSEFVDPKTDPLGPDNILVLASGPLAGVGASTGGRLSVGCKSPLTKGIKEANSGGMAGDALAGMGYRALVFRGGRPKSKPAVFLLDENGVRIEEAAAFMGMGNEELAKALYKKFGKDYVIISIGQAGEQLLLAAGVAVTDAEGKPFRLAARGGVGAVMGSKGLKAVLIRRPKKSGARELSLEAKKAVTAFNKHVAGSARVQVLRDYGTASTVMLLQKYAGMAVRNFSRGEIEGVEQISGEEIRKLILERGGEGSATHACMSGCVIQCSNAFPDKDGKLACAPVEFETIGLCGSNLELTSMDDIARINRICNDYGLDTIEVGAAIGVMMEAAESKTLPEGYKKEDLPHFGDGKRAAEVLADVVRGGILGQLLGNGVVATGKALGVTRIPAVKGQALSAYDPRAIKGTGVTYATSPQGADHTAGLTVFAPIDHRDASKAVAMSRGAQIQRAAYDAVGLCAFNTSATGQNPEIIIEMINKIYNLNLKPDFMDEIGRKVIEAELAFNKSAGFTSADDRLPEYFKLEPHPPVGNVWDIPDDALDHIWD